MATTPSIGSGSSFQYFTAGSWVALAQVTNITPPNRTRDVVDTTNMASGGDRTFLGALRDGGELSIELNYVSGAYGILNGLISATVTTAVRCVDPAGDIWEANTWLTNLSAEMPLDDKMTCTATFKVSGPPSYTVGAAAAPTNTLQPAVSGSPVQGQTLTAIEGDWTGAPAFTYQWQRGTNATPPVFSNISGATSRTYVAQAGDVGNFLRCNVTGTNGAGNATAASSRTALVTSS